MPGSVTNKQILESLNATVVETHNTIRTLQQEIKDSNSSLLVLETIVTRLENSLTNISKIVKDGNGDSLTTKVAVLQNDLRDTREWLQGIENNKYGERVKLLEDWRNGRKCSEHQEKMATVQNDIGIIKTWKKSLDDYDIREKVASLIQWKTEKENDKKANLSVRLAFLGAGVSISTTIIMIIIKFLEMWIKSGGPTQ